MRIPFAPTRVGRLKYSGSGNVGTDFGSPSWMPTNDATFAIISLWRKNGATNGPGLRLWNRDSGSNLTNYSTNGDGQNLRMVLNRGTDVSYNTGTTNILPPDTDLRWFWLAVVVNTGLGSGLKIAFYRRFLGEPRWTNFAATVISEGGGSGLNMNGTYKIGSAVTGSVYMDLALWLHFTQAITAGQLDQYFINDAEMYQIGAGGGWTTGGSGPGLRSSLALAVYPGRWGGGIPQTDGKERNDAPLGTLGEYGSAPSGGTTFESYVPAGNLFLDDLSAAIQILGNVPGASAQNVTATPAIIRYVGVAPTVTKGAVSQTATPAIVRYVGVTATVTPAAVAQAATPAVARYVGVTATVTPAAVAQTATPAIIRYVGVTASASTVGGAINVTATPAIIRYVGVAPTRSVGTVAQTATPAVVRYVGVTATISSALIQAASPAVVRYVAVAPAISSTLTRSATPAVVRWLAVAPAVASTLTRSATPAIVRWLGVTPSVSTISAINVTATPAVVRWISVAPALTLGTVSQAATPAVVRWLGVTAGVSVVGGPISVIASPAVIRYVASAPTISSALTRSATPAVVRYLASTPTRSGTTTTSATPAVIRYVASVPTRSVGAVIATGTPAVVTWRGVDAGVSAPGISVPGAIPSLRYASAVTIELVFLSGVATALLSRSAIRYELYPD